jgi:hypothetical protein
MAKAKTSPEDREKQQLLDALRKTLDGLPRLLQGAAKADPIFKSGAAGTALVNKALQEGYVEVSESAPPAGKRGKGTPPRFATLTEKGRQFVLDSDPLQQVLKELLPAVQKLSDETPGAGTSPADGLSRALAGGFDRMQRALWAEMEKSIRNMEKDLLAAIQGLATAPDRERKREGLLSAVLQAIEHARQAPAVPPAPLPPVQPTVRLEAAREPEWLDEVVRMTAEQKQRDPFKRLTLPEIFGRLQEKHPRLTIGQFHEGLRTLHERRSVKLLPFTQHLSTIGDTRNALYLDREVMYYADHP